MAANNKKTIQIDGEKLRREIEKRGLLGSDVAREIDYNPNAISQTISRGRISPQMLKLLTLAFNIKEDDIKITEPEKPERVYEQMRITPEEGPEFIGADVLAKKLASLMAPMIEDAIVNAFKRL